MTPDFSRQISLQCSTCGGTQFDFETDDGPLVCGGCNRRFTKEELIRANGQLIENEKGEMAKEVGDYARDELRKSFKRAFAGSKHIKFK